MESIATTAPRTPPFAQWPGIADKQANRQFHGQDPITALQTSSHAVCHPQPWHQQFDGWTDPVTGWRLRVPTTIESNVHGAAADPNPHYDFDSLMVSMDIYDGETAIGDIHLAMLLDANGQPEMRVGTMNVTYNVRDEVADPDNSRMGRGFGKRCLNEIFDWAGENGCPRVSLNTTGVGNYAWAQMGFDIDPRSLPGNYTVSSASEVAQTMWSRAQERQTNTLVPSEDKLSSEQLRQLHTEINRLFADGATPTMQELSQVGRWKQITLLDARSDHRRTALGTALMIEGVGWQGLRHLQETP